jgi:hypothetical protein
MGHAPKRPRPQAIGVNSTVQLFEYLDRFEAKLDRIALMIGGADRRAENRFDVELGVAIMNRSEMEQFVEVQKKLTDGVEANRSLMEKMIAELRKAAEVGTTSRLLLPRRRRARQRLQLNFQFRQWLMYRSKTIQGLAWAASRKVAAFHKTLINWGECSLLSLVPVWI